MMTMNSRQRHCICVSGIDGEKRDMTGRNLILSAAAGLLAAGTVSVAAAAVAPGSGGNEANPPADAYRPGLLLVQNGEVDIFFDARGRRVILDARTGEVIAIEEPGVRQRQWPQYDRLYESGVLSARPRDPDAVAAERYRRFREYQLGLREAPDEDFPDEEYQGYPQEDRIERRAIPEYGEAPEYEPVPEYGEAPEYARGEALERAPLPSLKIPMPARPPVLVRNFLPRLRVRPPARTSRNSRSCSTAPAFRPASSTARWAATSRRRSTPTPR